ncbi:MAG: hypothetical protein IIY89_06805 [Clostridia bacterium]|nr:hypothetical protein [Clostridia bacterium]
MNNEFNDDRDVKIFSGDSSDNNAPEDSEYVRLINEKKGSRNIRRAMQLGASLVMEIDRCIPDLNSGVMALSDDLDPMLLHRSMLLVFSIIIGMEQYIPGKALVGTALNVFYDTLKKEDPKLYDDMSATGSLTFYYLAYRRDGEPKRRVAQAFAMLCGDENNEDLIQVGEAIYHRYRHMVREYVDGIGFEPEDQ